MTAPKFFTAADALESPGAEPQEYRDKAAPNIMKIFFNMDLKNF